MLPLEIGQSISYVLLPKDNPTDPNHEYHGIIRSIDGTQIKVELTDAGCEGEEEWIDGRQIRSVEGEEKGEENRWTGVDFDRFQWTFPFS